MGQRSRKRRATSGGGEAPAPRAERPARPPRVRGEAKNAEIREGLQPFGPGERPPALIVAAVVAALLGGGNLVAYVAGIEIDGERPGAGGVLLFSAVLLTAAAGLWGKRYWAVLGFVALLALITLTFSLFLLRASNVLAVLISLTVIGLAGVLFFRLIRVMARLQVPQRPGR